MKYDKNHALLECLIPGLESKSGKVRDVYDLGDKLLMVVTDRISAFDVILPCGVPDKGKVLNSLSLLDGLPRHEEPPHNSRCRSVSCRTSGV